MSTSGDIFKSFAKGFGREFIRAGGAVAKGIKTDSKMDNKVSGIETDVKRPEKVTLSGVLGQVVKGSMGSKVPEAGIRADRSGWKKPVAPIKPDPVPQKVDTSAFAKKYSLNRIEADRWLKKDVVSKDLINKFIRYYPKKARETDWQRAQRIEKELFGGVKDPVSPYAGPIGPYIEKGADKYKLLARKKELLKRMRTERNPREKERKKLNITMFDRFTGGNTKK
jgi:hypothetical protein